MGNSEVQTEGMEIMELIWGEILKTLLLIFLLIIITGASVGLVVGTYWAVEGFKMLIWLLKQRRK